jgi:2-iminoacetate synthase
MTPDIQQLKDLLAEAADILAGTTVSSEEQVRTALQKQHPGPRDLATLLSPLAAPLLEEMAGAARNLTIQRFGRIIQFYIPLYLSSACENACLYCGYNRQLPIKRITLSMEEIDRECRYIRELGFDSILLLTGEAPGVADCNYIREAVSTARRYFTFVGLEVFPMNRDEYHDMAKAGANGLTLYQETYHEPTYGKMHVQGKKSDYNFRLEAPERALSAGIRKVGLGALLGLHDWRYEAMMLATHARYLQKKYWKSEFSISFPRMLPLASGFTTPSPVSDRELVQMMSALRLYMPDTGFVLSTRESPELRNRLIGLCTTQISAGSVTSPGGYTSEGGEEQFSICDTRSLDEMIALVSDAGYDPVIKDWDTTFQQVEYQGDSRSKQ